MIYYCMSDIHGCLSAFNDALDLVLEHLNEPNTSLILMGDYIHSGEDSYGVLDRIMSLQKRYGRKVIVLMGNHEEMVLDGRAPISEYYSKDSQDDRYIMWLYHLPLYHADGKTIFVHAGIDEEAEEEWEYGTMDFVFTEKYPAQMGYFYEDYKIVAGHVYTSEISGDPHFNRIYYDGESHYYIDADTVKSGFVNVLKVDTDRQEYYEVTPEGEFLVQAYDEIE